MNREENLTWWREAKLGLFIHWGIYSLLGQGEWVMYFKRIPAGEYEKLAGQFNPTKFDAREWVRFARGNGMKYIVITAKHHDGFSMFQSEVSPFNVVNTPFGRDPLAELAKACKEEGIRLGFYYSHVREWRHPKAASLEKKGRGDLYGNYGNFWDYPNENVKDLQGYIEEFDIPQIRELLTRYGDILTIWFDTPSQITPAQGEQIKRAVYETQEGTLVNSRLSYDIPADYLTMDDDAIPASGLDVPWETPMTTHNGWGYVENARYRDGHEIIEKIAEVASKGGNLLINVGPDSQGRIPEGARHEFARVGRWLQTNGEAIYGTTGAGFPYTPHWGYVTRKGNSLYLILTKKKSLIGLTGLESRAGRCLLLGENRELTFSQKGDTLEIRRDFPDEEIPVIRVDFPEGLSVRSGIYPGEEGNVELEAGSSGIMRGYPYSHLEVKNGITELWTSPEDYLFWEFSTREEASYQVIVVWDAKGFWGIEDLGHILRIETEDQVCRVEVSDAFPEKDGIRCLEAGTVRLSPGRHHLELIPEKICTNQLMGLRIRGVMLEREEKE